MNKTIVGVVMAMGMLSACSGAPPVQRNSEAMERSRRLLAALDRVEADLHQGDSELTTFGVLLDRHQQATQLTCQVSQVHVDEIHRLEVAQEKKRSEKRKHRSMALAEKAPGHSS